MKIFRNRKAKKKIQNKTAQQTLNQVEKELEDAQVTKDQLDALVEKVNQHNINKMGTEIKATTGQILTTREDSVRQELAHLADHYNGRIGRLKAQAEEKVNEAIGWTEAIRAQLRTRSTRAQAIINDLNKRADKVNGLSSFMLATLIKTERYVDMQTRCAQLYTEIVTDLEKIFNEGKRFKDDLAAQDYEAETQALLNYLGEK